MCGGRASGQQRLEAVGDDVRLPGLGVAGGAADVRCQHDVGHARQRVIGWQPLADEVVETGCRQLAAAQRVDERVGVVQLGPGGVEVDRAVAHRGELLGADHARSSRR